MRKTLIITDLTYMWGDDVCNAGVDAEGRCVRPVTRGGVKREHLFGSRLLGRGAVAVYPRARVTFDLTPTEVIPPHVEDEEFEARSIVAEGACEDYEWEHILLANSFGSVEDVFDGYLEGGRRVPPGARTRSLGTVADIRILAVKVDDTYGRLQFRLDFADATGRRYWRYPVNDLAFRAALQANVDALGDDRKAEQAILLALRLSERVYVRVGLARPEQLGSFPEACWTQVTGIYTFPDYLNSKTFADFD